MQIKHVVYAVGLLVAIQWSAYAADTRVVDAAKAGRTAVVRTLIKQRADVNQPEADGTTALHWAVRSGDRALVDALLAAGAKVNATNRYGVTPLSLAAIAGDAGIVKRLVDAGADAKATLADGESVLMLAARTGNVDTIKLLAARGADVNGRESWMGETPLIWAAAENNTAAVRALVALGAKVDGRSASVQYPAQKPKDPSNYVSSAPPKGEWTPLMYAARENAAETALALIELGADVNARDPEGMTPLLEAIVNMHLDLAAKLVEKGANANLVDKAGMSPLFAAVDMRTPAWERGRPDPEERDSLDCLDMMKVLLDHGANPNLALTGRMLQRYHANGIGAVGEGSTPLLRAAYYDNLDMVRLLVERGANVNAKQKDGTTALMLASGVKYALTQEGDPKKSGSVGDAYEIVKLLTEKGADVNAENATGQTALYGAAFVGREPVIKYLAAHGARLDAKTKQGLTIYDAVLNTGVADEGTGSRVGGKPGPEIVALVRQLMEAAGAPVVAKGAERIPGGLISMPRRETPLVPPPSLSAPVTTPGGR